MINPSPEQSLGKILVVDDDPGIREAITWALEDEKWRVVTANNGIAGLATLKRHPDSGLILFDN